jgi:hypothetical protein
MWSACFLSGRFHSQLVAQIQNDDGAKLQNCFPSCPLASFAGQNEIRPPIRSAQVHLRSILIPYFSPRPPARLL